MQVGTHKSSLSILVSLVPYLQNKRYAFSVSFCTDILWANPTAHWKHLSQWRTSQHMQITWHSARVKPGMKLFYFTTFLYSVLWFIEVMALYIKKPTDSSKVTGAFVRESYKSLLYLGNWYKSSLSFYKLDWVNSLPSS